MQYRPPIPHCVFISIENSSWRRADDCCLHLATRDAKQWNQALVHPLELYLDSKEQLSASCHRRGSPIAQPRSLPEPILLRPSRLLRGLYDSGNRIRAAAKRSASDLRSDPSNAHEAQRSLHANSPVPGANRVYLSTNTPSQTKCRNWACNVRNGHVALEIHCCNDALPQACTYCSNTTQRIQRSSVQLAFVQTIRPPVISLATKRCLFLYELEWDQS